jgi:hypothetical protein
MYCPRCGQQQATDAMRFCSRCGFLMEGTMHLLANGGVLPVVSQGEGEKGRSARAKGVMQGAALFLLGVLIVPILAIMSSFAPGRLENVFGFFAAVSAIVFFVGGPLRMLFAGLFEQGAPKYPQFTPTNFSPAVPPARVSALPPPAVNPAAQWRRPDTGEIQPPVSVTDSTTKLLDREPKRD